MTEPRKHEKYDTLIDSCHALAPLRTAVAHPCDETSLSGAVEAAAARIIEPVLVGPEARIRALAASLSLDITGLHVVDMPHSHAAAEKTVELVRGGEAAALMKGSLHTDELMAEVVRKDTGIRTARRISHVFIMDVPTYAKLLFITDAAVKHITSTVAGDADILLVPDLEAGNMLAKELSFLANADAAGIVLGTRVPIMLTSRADNVRARMASCAVAALYAHARRVIAAGIGKLAG